MALSIALPDHYGWVLLAVSSFGFLNLYQTRNVTKHRKAAGVKYPQMYAEKADEEKSLAARQFNCAQRAHQNTLESFPHFLSTLLIAGLKYPTLSASLGAAWFVGRVMYTIGYSSGQPDKRRFGLPLVFGPMLILQGLSAWTAWEFARSTL